VPRFKKVSVLLRFNLPSEVRSNRVKRFDVKCAISGDSCVNYSTNVAQIFDDRLVLTCFIVALTPSAFLMKKDVYIVKINALRCLLVKPDSHFSSKTNLLSP